MKRDHDDIQQLLSIRARLIQRIERLSGEGIDPADRKLRLKGLVDERRDHGCDASGRPVVRETRWLEGFEPASLPAPSRF